MSESSVLACLHAVTGDSQVALVIKNLPANTGHVRDAGLIPGSGRFPGGGNDNPLQYSCLENPMDRGAWWATVHGVSRSRTRLKRLSTQLLRNGHKWGGSAPLGVLWHPLLSQWTWGGSMEALSLDCQHLQATHPPPWRVLILSLGWVLKTKWRASPNTSWPSSRKVVWSSQVPGWGNPQSNSPRAAVSSLAASASRLLGHTLRMGLGTFSAFSGR